MYMYTDLLDRIEDHVSGLLQHWITCKVFCAKLLLVDYTLVLDPI